LVQVQDVLEAVVAYPVPQVDDRHAILAAQALEVILDQRELLRRIPGAQDAVLGQVQEGDLDVMRPALTQQFADGPVGIGGQHKAFEGRQREPARHLDVVGEDGVIDSPPAERQPAPGVQGIPVGLRLDDLVPRLSAHQEGGPGIEDLGAEVDDGHQVGLDGLDEDLPALTVDVLEHWHVGELAIPQGDGETLLEKTFVPPEGGPDLHDQPVGVDAVGQETAQGEQFADGAGAEGGEVEGHRGGAVARLPLAEVGGTDAVGGPRRAQEDHQRPARRRGELVAQAVAAEVPGGVAHLRMAAQKPDAEHRLAGGEQAEHPEQGRPAPRNGQTPGDRPHDGTP
jgi:hypothetical protein